MCMIFVKMVRKKISDCIQDGDDGVYLDLIVSTNSLENKIIGVDQWRNRLKVTVKERAEDGRANNSLIDLISDEFQIQPIKVEIVQGKRTNKKRVFLLMDRKEVKSILSNILEVK